MDCYDWIYDWEYNSDDFKRYQDLPLHFEKCFQKNKTPYTLYRGLKWNESDAIAYMQKTKGYFKLDNINENDIISLTLTDLTSWSKDVTIAEVFANNKDYGMIIQTVTSHPNRVLVDIDLTLKDNRLGEVILLPNTYKCKVVSIFRNRPMKLYKDAEI